MSDVSRSTVKRLLRRLVKIAIVLSIVVAAAYGLLRWHIKSLYPYGSSHSCIKVLGGALANYAEAHDGFFPRGEATPEASLSLLAGRELHFVDEPEIAVQILRGKTIAADKVQRRLTAGELLDPESCGWHYVEGLTLQDDPALAILWDKVGLGHNGQRLADGGHEVLFDDGTSRIVSGSEWPGFLDRQHELLASRNAAAEKGQPALTARIKLPAGEIVDHFDGPFVLSETNSTADGNSSGSRLKSGDSLGPSNLRWFRLNSWGADGAPLDSTHTFTLTLGKLKSRSVDVKVSGDQVTPDSIVFEMPRSD